MEFLKPLVMLAMLLLDFVLVAGRGCGQSCSSNDDCDGQLYCGSGKCKDDPDLGTHICSGSQTPSPAGGGGSCKSSGSFQGSGGHSCDECCKANTQYPIYKCSPPVSQSTSAMLTVNNFSAGGDGGGPSKCDGSYHGNGERIVALSTGWYAGGSRCGKFITISARGRTTTAKVVDECDSTRGCDEEHAYQRPCDYNIVDGSDAVWEALGVFKSDPQYGFMQVTWRQ